MAVRIDPLPQTHDIQPSRHLHTVRAAMRRRSPVTVRRQRTRDLPLGDVT